jgi:hypothetical protein
MVQKTKWHLILAVFLLCWLVFLGIPYLVDNPTLLPITNLFQNESANLVFLMVLFLMVSLVAADLFEFLYGRARRLKWFRPRLGEVLVSRGFITREDLDEALELQRLRIGDMLVRLGKITPDQLEDALARKHGGSDKRIGDILRDMKVAEDRDIEIATAKINRKLGKVLVEKGLITEYDLKRILGRMWYSRDRGL